MDEDKKRQAPETLIQLLFVLAKSFIRNLPKNIVLHLVIFVISFFIVLFIHTYLIVGVNEGFYADPESPFISMMALDEYRPGAIVFWSIAMFLASTLIYKMRKRGIFKFFIEIAGSPVWLVKCFRYSGRTGLVYMLTTAAVTVMLGLLIKSPAVMAVFALMVFFSYAHRTSGILLYTVKIVRTDWQRLFRRKMRIDSASVGAMSLVVFGLFTGLLLSFVIPLKPYGSFAVSILLIIAAIAARRKGVPANTVITPAILFTLGIILLKVLNVYADDGGWQESGGTLGDWLSSPGALTAVGMGIAPAAAGAAGIALGWLFGVDLPDISVDGVTEGQDGGSTELSPDGTLTEISPDGTITSTAPDGTITTNDMDGVQSIEASDGTTVATSQDGSGVIIGPDGSLTAVSPDGTMATVGQDGGSTELSQDGTLTEISPDGTITSTAPDGTITTNDMEGVQAIEASDGTTVATSQDGSGVIIGPDGSLTAVSPDGTMVTVGQDDGGGTEGSPDDQDG